MTRTTEPSWVILYQDNKTKGLINHPQTSNQGKLVITQKRENFVRRNPHSGPMIGPNKSSTSVKVMWCMVSFGMQVEVVMHVFLFVNVLCTKLLFP